MTSNSHLIKKVFVPITILTVFLYISILSLSVASNLLVPLYGTAAVIPFLKVYQLFPQAILVILLLIFSYKKPFAKIFTTTLIVLAVFLGLSALFIFFQETLWSFSPKDQAGSINMLLTNLPATLFTFVAGLFNINLVYVLVWGFINQITTVEEGKRMFIPFAFVLGILYGFMAYLQGPFFRFGVFPLTLIAIFFIITAIITFQRTFGRLSEERLLEAEGIKVSFPFITSGFFLASCLIISYLSGLLFRSAARSLVSNPNVYSKMIGQYSVTLGISVLVLSIIWVIVGLYLIKRKGFAETVRFVTYSVFCVGVLYIIFSMTFSNWIGNSIFTGFFKGSQAVMLFPLIQILYLYFPTKYRFSNKILTEMIFVPLWQGAANYTVLQCMVMTGSFSNTVPYLMGLTFIILISLIGVGKHLRKYEALAI